MEARNHSARLGRKLGHLEANCLRLRWLAGLALGAAAAACGPRRWRGAIPSLRAEILREREQKGAGPIERANSDKCPPVAR